MAAFDDFFCTATGLEAPFDYQRTLATCPQASFPELLDVPTGLGKTAAVVLAWLWRRRGHEDAEVRRATPRRLVYCLPMRVLVEQTHRNVRAWLERLGLLGTPGEGGVSVHLLMGGEEDLSSWADHPEEDAVLIGTQDMLLSRALMRGYGMSRYQWPVHFALLHNDSLWVLDEVQLMGPGLATACQLEALRRRFGTERPASTLWVSATLHPDWLDTVDLRPHLPGFTSLGLGKEEQRTGIVQKRCQAPKALERSEVVLEHGSGERHLRGYATALAAKVTETHRTGTTTLVVVNTVARAQAIFRALGRARVPATRLLLHGRFRPAERRRLDAALRDEPGAEGRVIVATQAVEAGVDLSSRTLFTELAPWSSLVQRFGRCNRYGEAEDARVYWVDMNVAESAAPYEQAELAAARGTLENLDSASPARLPPVRPGRAVVEVMRDRDLQDLFNTDPDLSGFDTDVSRFIRDTDAAGVQLFWRDVSEGVTDQPAPARDELCPCSLGEARNYVVRVQKAGSAAHVWDALEERWRPLNAQRLRPGLTLLCPASRGGYDPEAGMDARATQPVEPVAPAERLPRSYGSDPRSAQPVTVPLIAHLTHVEAAAQQVCELAGLDDGVAKAVRLAARWHDVGKLHEVFQATLTACGEMAGRDGGPWAKSPCRGRHRRPHLRHELASALAWLAHHGDDDEADLVAYLIAAHHGKVRMGLRSLPGEHEPPDPGVRFARGIWEGDELPAFTREDGEMLPATTLLLHLMELGEGPQGPSWTARTQRLLARFGPFRLAWREALVRVADWRASRAEQTEAGSSTLASGSPA